MINEEYYKKYEKVISDIFYQIPIFAQQDSIGAEVKIHYFPQNSIFRGPLHGLPGDKHNEVLNISVDKVIDEEYILEITAHFEDPKDMSPEKVLYKINFYKDKNHNLENFMKIKRSRYN